MNHLKLQQTTSSVEVVTSSIIDKLYSISQSTLDDTSDILGNLQVTHAYQDAIDYLLNKFPNLQINVTGGAYIRFADPVVASICATNWGDGTGITNLLIKSVTSLGGYFSNNTLITNFKELDLFTNLHVLGANEFSGCTNLTSVGSLSNITSILGSAFNNAANLVINNLNLVNCTSLGLNSFYRTSFNGTKGITGVLLLPLITTIPISTFESLSFTEVLAPNLTTINKYSFYNCLNLATIDLTNITSVSYASFYGCSNLKIVLNMPNLSLLVVDSTGASNDRGAFNASGITGIENLGTIRYIGIGYPQSDRGLFGNCPNLRYVKLPSTLLGIAARSFVNDPALLYVVCYATTPPSLDADAFLFTNSTFKIYVPDSSVAAYKAATNWSSFSSRIFSLTQFAVDFPNG